jgi:hypothetical protein
MEWLTLCISYSMQRLLTLVIRFMQSDPFWSCAMAVNVYLVFFRRYDAIRLKKLYWIYGLLCYGLPFIPAMFCLFYKTKKKGRMYGNATVRQIYPSKSLCTDVAISSLLLAGSHFILTLFAAVVLDRRSMGASSNLLLLRSYMGLDSHHFHNLHSSWRRDIPKALTTSNSWSRQ